MERWTDPDISSFLIPPSSASSVKWTSVPLGVSMKRNSPRGRAGPATTWNAYRDGGSFAVTSMSAPMPRPKGPLMTWWILVPTGTRLTGSIALTYGRQLGSLA